MKKITKTYETYTYDELSKEAQEKVLENLHDISVEDDWFEFEFEEIIESLAKMGFEDAKIFFSGFYSQGDGACFTANLDIDKVVKYFKLKTKYAHLLKKHDITGCIRAGGHYSHANTMSIDIDAERKDGKEMYTESTEQENFKEEILDLARTEADEIYDDLKKSYEYLTSEKSIVEMIEVNEYTFLEDGKMFNE